MALEMILVGYLSGIVTSVNERENKDLLPRIVKPALFELRTGHGIESARHDRSSDGHGHSSRQGDPA
jgi:hypothetical protein